MLARATGATGVEGSSASIVLPKSICSASRHYRGRLTMRCSVILVIVLALPQALAGHALGGAPLLSPPSTVESQRTMVQASTEQQRAQRALEAKQKVERNRRCRPAVEKDYAGAIERCKQRLGPEQADDRQKCFSAARDQYFKQLRECNAG